MYQSHFMAQKEDRLVLFSDGVTQSGIGTNDMPFGWEDEGVEAFVLSMEQSDGRRFKRAVLINISSVKFCAEPLLTKLRKVQILHGGLH